MHLEDGEGEQERKEEVNNTIQEEKCEMNCEWGTSEQDDAHQIQLFKQTTSTMSRTLFALLIVGVLVNVIGAYNQLCPENQEWKSCGTACPPTCSNPNPQICTLQCVIGCQCKNGYLLNPSGHCVLPSEC
ncbi:hypothetical protein HN011_009229 [Eciton burchellii]|nr:hypothetical protein HN011_009229 [Eciton burchellii]